MIARPARLLTDWQNWVWLGLVAIAVLLTGVARPYRKAIIAAACAATALLAVLLLAQPPAVEPLEINGGSLYKTTGREEGPARVASQGLDAAGFMIFGPYVALRAGCYETQLFYDADYPPDGHPAVWDGYAGGRVLARGEVPAAGRCGAAPARAGRSRREHCELRVARVVCRQRPDPRQEARHRAFHPVRRLARDSGREVS